MQTSPLAYCRCCDVATADVVVVCVAGVAVFAIGVTVDVGVDSDVDSCVVVSVIVPASY